MIGARLASRLFWSAFPRRQRALNAAAAAVVVMAVGPILYWKGVDTEPKHAIGLAALGALLLAVALVRLRMADE